jgi:hypothetical protein
MPVVPNTGMSSLAHVSLGRPGPEGLGNCLPLVSTAGCAAVSDYFSVPPAGPGPGRKFCPPGTSFAGWASNPSLPHASLSPRANCSLRLAPNDVVTHSEAFVRSKFFKFFKLSLPV